MKIIWNMNLMTMKVKDMMPLINWKTRPIAPYSLADASATIGHQSLSHDLTAGPVSETRLAVAAEWRTASMSRNDHGPLCSTDMTTELR